MSLEIRPISISAANSYIEQHHRHHGKRIGCRFAICIYDETGLHGVAICSNPVARNADDGLTLEVSRLCTDGIKNGCSILYGACARIAKDMGFHKIQTYILQSETGTSLKASGWHLEADNVGTVDWTAAKNERQRKRNEKPKQMSMFQETKPPAELKQRWVRILKNAEPWRGEEHG